MCIVFTFFHAVFYSCHHSLGLVKGKEFLDWWSWHILVRKKGSAWRLFDGPVLKNSLYRKCKQTAVISFMQCKILIIDMPCFIW